MTQPQPPAPQVIYVERPTDVVGVFAWITAIVAILAVPFWAVPFGIVPLAALLVSFCLTVAAGAGGRRSGHWTAAVVLLVVVLVLNVLAAVALT